MQPSNSNLLSVLFDSACLKENQLDLNANVYSHGGISQAFIPSDSFQSFFLSSDRPSILGNCILDVAYDLQVEVQSLQEISSCYIEHINEIFYDSVRKPDAWHLDLLDQKKDLNYSMPLNLNHNSNEVDIWILDTGINYLHREFFPGQVIDMDPSFSLPNLTVPHGTGTSDCAAGLNYGASKNLTIYNYPVCRQGGSCSGGDIINGLEAALDHLNKTKKRSVINLSLGASLGYDPTNTSIGTFYNSLFKEILDAGGIVVVSAGNSNEDACTWVYSFSPYVISVGSVNNVFNKSSFSNYGPCVDIWSFGENVPMAYSVNDNSTVQYKSGTSFSSPIVAGLVANLLQANNSLSRDDILYLLSSQNNNFTVPLYDCKVDCGKKLNQCCQGKQPHTRLDMQCRQHGIKNCPKNCILKDC